MLDKLNVILDDLAKECLKGSLNVEFLKEHAFRLADFRDEFAANHPSIVPTDNFNERIENE